MRWEFFTTQKIAVSACQIRARGQFGLKILAAALCAAPLLARAQDNCTSPNDTASFILGEAGGTAAMHWATGLVWQRCAIGQTWSGSTCTGTPTEKTWVDWAHTQALLPFAFAGQQDWGLPRASTFNQNLLEGGAWRMPYVGELQHLTSNCGGDPRINRTVFPGSPTILWTASPATTSEWAHVIGVNRYGNGFGKVDEVQAALRAVRGGQPFASLPPAPPARSGPAGAVVRFDPIVLAPSAPGGLGQAWGGARITGAGNPAFQINGAGPWLQEAIVRSADQITVRLAAPPAVGSSHGATLTLRSAETSPTGDGGDAASEGHVTHTATLAFTATATPATPPGSVRPVPTLGAWAQALLTLAAAALGLRVLRGRQKI